MDYQAAELLVEEKYYRVVMTSDYRLPLSQFLHGFLVAVACITSVPPCTSSVSGLSFLPELCWAPALPFPVFNAYTIMVKWERVHPDLISLPTWVLIQSATSSSLIISTHYLVLQSYAANHFPFFKRSSFAYKSSDFQIHSTVNSGYSNAAVFIDHHFWRKYRCLCLFALSSFPLSTSHPLGSFC